MFGAVCKGEKHRLQITLINLDFRFSSDSPVPHLIKVRTSHREKKNRSSLEIRWDEF